MAATGNKRSRYRADCVLQDGQFRYDDLWPRVEIEQGQPKSPIEIEGGIEERVESLRIEAK